MIRKAYVRKDGTRVKAAVIADKGKPGRTPKSKQWYDPKVHTGWKKSDPATTRRRRAIIAHKGNRLAAARALQSLANVNTDPVTRRLAALDARYIFKMYKKYGNG